MEPKAKTPEIALRLRQGRKIKAYRTLKGDTQLQLAQGVGVTKAAVSDWEAGKSYPRPHHQLEIARYFGAPWSSLFGLDGEHAA